MPNPAIGSLPHGRTVAYYGKRETKQSASAAKLQNPFSVQHLRRQLVFQQAVRGADEANTEVEGHVEL